MALVPLKVKSNPLQNVSRADQGVRSWCYNRR